MDSTIERIEAEQDDFKRKMLFLAWLRQMPTDDFIVVGGHALEIYSFGKYVSGDIDLVASELGRIEAKLAAIGFKKEGKNWVSEKLRLFVEIVSNKLTGDITKVRDIIIGGNSYVRVIGIEDLILDRLNSCVHWNYVTDCEWAEYLVKKFKDTLDVHYLKEKAKEDNVLNRLEDCLK